MSVPSGLGSILLGGLTSAMLYGITTLQTYVYFMHYSEDTSAVKFLVASIWVLDTLHVSVMCHIQYHYLITGYGALLSLEYIIWSFPASVLVNSLVVAAVQCFFAYKIYYLCRAQVKWLLTAPIIFFVLARFVFGVEMAAQLLADNQFTSLQKIRFNAVTPFSAALVIAEILITVSLCVLLYDNGSHSAFPRTKRLLNTLIIYAVNRCLLTLLVALAELIAILCNEDAWAVGFDFNVGKLYANSLLASLNTRKYLRSQGFDPNSDLPRNAVQLANLPNLSGDGETSKY